MDRMPFLVAVLASMPLGLLALRRPRATGVQDTMSMGEKQGCRLVANDLLRSSGTADARVGYAPVPTARS